MTLRNEMWGNWQKFPNEKLKQRVNQITKFQSNYNSACDRFLSAGGKEKDRDMMQKWVADLDQCSWELLEIAKVLIHRIEATNDQ